jgi:hypothetical protein
MSKQIACNGFKQSKLTLCLFHVISMSLNEQIVKIILIFQPERIAAYLAGFYPTPAEQTFPKITS